MEKEVWQPYKANGVQVLGINAGDPERKAKAFKEQHKLTFPYLMDREQTVIDQFSADGALPHVAIIGKDFTVLYSETGGTAASVVDKLKDILGNGKPAADKVSAATKQEARQNQTVVADLGVETRPPTQEEAKRLALKAIGQKPNGQTVTRVRGGGPAERVGLKPGDVIVRLDANELYSRDDLDDFLRVSKPGASVKVIVKSPGSFGREKETELSAILGERVPTEQEAKLAAFAWDFAGPAQLPAAMVRAKKEGKSVLVGLSGAET